MAVLTQTRERLARQLDPAEIRHRLTVRAASTPGRLGLFLVAITALAVIAGLAAVIGAAQRADLVDQVGTRSGPLTVQAQQLYRSLSDADATAAAAFLSSGAEPAALRERYTADIAAATTALAAATSAGDATTDQGAQAVSQIAQALPVYTGLVETARTYNRLNLPVAAAYLREASGLMRDRLLPNAQKLYQAESDRLTVDRDGASSAPWLAILLILATLASLVVAQLFLIRRTRRLVNVGLATATAAGLVALIWLVGSWIGVAVNLSAGRQDGSAQVAVVAQARIAALQARADEALTLVARGSGGAFDSAYGTTMTDLAGADGTAGLLGQARAQATDPAVRDALATATTAVADWRTVHKALRALDNGGQYPQAVTMAIGDPSIAGGDLASAAHAFNRVDDALATAIARANATFDERAGAADSATTALAVGLAVLIVVLIAGLIVGLQQRIAEYR